MVEIINEPGREGPEGTVQVIYLLIFQFLGLFLFDWKHFSATTFPHLSLLQVMIIGSDNVFEVGACSHSLKIGEHNVLEAKYL